MQVALCRRREEALRTGVLRLGAGRSHAPLVDAWAVVHRVQNPVRPLPREFLGRPQDRTERDADPRRVGTAGRDRRGAYRCDLLLGFGQRLAPQHECLGVLATDPVRGLGRPAEEQWNVADRLDLTYVVLEAVVAALVVERFGGRPRLLQDFQVLVGPVVALVFVEVVAVALLLGVATAGDRVDGDPAAAELIQRRERTGGERRRHEAGPVRNEQAEALGVLGNVRGDLRTVRPAGSVADQDAVESAVLVRAGKPLRVVRVDDGAVRRVDLARMLRADHAEEFDGHAGTPSRDGGDSTGCDSGD